MPKQDTERTSASRSHRPLLQRVLLQAVGVLLLLVILITTIDFLWLITIHSPAKLAWNPYSFSELLINYSQGFIRRGLIGAAIQAWSHGGSALPATNTLLFANFCVLAGSITVLALRKAGNRIWNAVFLLVMPGGALCMAVTGDFFQRKEIFFSSTLALCGLALALLQQIARPTLRKIAAYALIAALLLFSIVLSLIHETFLFLAAPATVFLILAAARSASSTTPPTAHAERSTTRLYAAAMLLLFVVLMGFPCKPAAALRMWNGLNATDRYSMNPDMTIFGGMSMFMLKPLEEFTHPYVKMIAGSAWYWFVPAFGSMLYCLGLVGWNIKAKAGAQTTEDRTQDFYRWVLCYLTLAACALPLFFIAKDWGRWLVSMNWAFLVLWLSIEPRNLATIHLQRLPGWLLRPARLESLRRLARSFSASYLSLITRHTALVLSVMFLFAITFRMHELFVFESQWYLLALAAHGLNLAVMHLFHIHSLSAG